MQTKASKIYKILTQVDIPNPVSIAIVGLWFWWLTDIFTLAKLEWFESITAPVWASLIALAGVVFTIQNGNKQRDKDRDMSLRREIYLDAAAAITKWQLLIGSLGNQELSQTKIDEEFQNISPALAKIDVIATNHTLIATSRLKSELLDLYLYLLIKRQPIVMQKISIDIINNTIRYYTAKQKYYFRIMDEINLTYDPSKQASYNTAQNSINFWNKELEKLYDEIDVLRIKQNEEIQIFSKILSDKIRDITEFTIPALLSVRKELGFPIDEGDYHKTLNDNNTRIGDSLQKFFDGIQKLFTSESKSS